MKNLYLLFIIFIGCTAPHAQTASEFANFEPTTSPDRIMLSIPGNPATSRAVSWRTAFEDTVSIGEIARMDAAPELEQNPVQQKGIYAPWETGNLKAMGHKVVFENLQPSTQYAYRVGNGEQWSEWFHFETSSDKTEPFSFLYFGDVQNDIKSYCSRTLRQAYSHFPNADFMLFAGDLVSRSQEEYWREFFYAGGWIFGMMPSIATPGNHEYDKPENQARTFSNHWQQIFTFPANSPAKEYENRSYYLDYQGVRFVSLDSPALGEYKNDSTLVLNWLDQTLAENPHSWTIVFTHYPVYSCSQGRNAEWYRRAVKPILEEHGVDLVLQGHDHTYCRGQNLENVNPETKNPPMYVVSVAGPKMYGLNTSFWSDRMASETQLYQHIGIAGDTLSFKSFMVNGQLYDDFMLIKTKGSANKVVVSEDVAEITQRTNIPEKAKQKYTEEEILKYKQQFSNN